MELIRIHPVVYIVYYLFLIVFAMVYKDLYYLIAFMMVLLVLFYFEGILSKLKVLFKLFVPLALLIIVLNCITCKVGESRVYFFSDYFITLEAFVFGLFMVFSLFLVLMILELYNNVVSYHEMLYVFSKKFPKISLIIIMALRFIPLVTVRLREFLKVNSVIDENGKFKDKIENMGSLFGGVISWSLEESMFTAKSMKSRGYGVTERTSYLSFKLGKVDYVFIILMVISLLMCFYGLTVGKGLIQIYPCLDFGLNDSPVDVFYVSYLVFLLLLVVLEVRERLYWVNL